MAENVVHIALKVDPRGSVRVLQSVEKGVDNLGKSVSAADKKLAGMNRASKSTISMMKQLAVAFGAYKVLEASVRIMRNSINAAGEFESALVDMAKVTDEPLSAIREKIQEIDPVLGNSTELVQGYYQVISAGVSDPVKSLDTLKVAAMTAKVAHIEQEEVVKGLTKVMASYAKENVTATQAAELLFAMEKAGQTSVAELIPYIGKLAAKSAALGISQEELAAAFGAVTKLAGNTSRAATQYDAVMTNLAKPTEAMTDLLDDYGGAQKAIKDLGFEGVLRLITTEADGNTEKLAELMGSSEALSAVIAMTANDFEAFSASMEVAEDRSGKLDKAFQNYTGTYQAVKDKFDNTLHNLFIQLGEELLPVVTEKLDEFAVWFQVNKDDIVAALKTMMDAGITFADTITKVFSIFKGKQETVVEKLGRQHKDLKNSIKDLKKQSKGTFGFLHKGNLGKAEADLKKIEKEMRIFGMTTSETAKETNFLAQELFKGGIIYGKGANAVTGLKRAAAQLLAETKETTDARKELTESEKESAEIKKILEALNKKSTGGIRQATKSVKDYSGEIRELERSISDAEKTENEFVTSTYDLDYGVDNLTKTIQEHELALNKAASQTRQNIKHQNALALAMEKGMPDSYDVDYGEPIDRVKELAAEAKKMREEMEEAAEASGRAWKDFAQDTKSQFTDTLAGGISKTFDSLLGDVKYKKFYQNQAREIEGVIDQLKQQKAAHEAGVESTEAQIQAYRDQGKPVDDLIKQMDDQKASVEKINEEIKKQEDAHKDALDGAEKAYDGFWDHVAGGFGDLWKDILGSFKDIVSKGIAKSLMNALTGGKEGGGIGDILGSIKNFFTGGDKEGGSWFSKIGKIFGDAKSAGGGFLKTLGSLASTGMTAVKGMLGLTTATTAATAGLTAAGTAGLGAANVAGLAAAEAAAAGAGAAGAGTGAGAAGAGVGAGMAWLGPAATIAAVGAVGFQTYNWQKRKSERRQLRRDMGDMDKAREEALAAGDAALAEEYQARLDAYAERFIGSRGVTGVTGFDKYRKNIADDTWDETKFEHDSGWRTVDQSMAEGITKKYGAEISNIEFSRMAVNMRNEIEKVLAGGSGDALIEFNAAIASLDSTTFEQKMDALGLTGSNLGWTGDAALDMVAELGKGDVPWDNIRKYLADAGVTDAEVIKTIRAAYDKGKSGLKAVEDLYEALKAEGVDEKVIKSIVADYKADGRIDDMDQLHDALDAQGLDDTAIKNIVSRFSGEAGMRSVDDLHEALKAEGIDERTVKSIVTQFSGSGGVGSMDELYKALKAQGVDASAIKSITARFSGSGGIGGIRALTAALTAEGVDDTTVKTLQAQVAGQPGLKDWPALKNAMVKTGIDAVTIKKIQGQYAGEGNYREFSGMLTGKGVPSSVSRRVVGKVDVPPVKADVGSFNRFRMQADPRDFNNFQMELGGRALGGPLFYAAGGWLSQHPSGGMIAGGSGIRDDVFLGHSYWGMAREYVVNQAATRANRQWLDWINFKGGRVDDLLRSVQGFAAGGYLPDPIVGKGLPTYEMPRHYEKPGHPAGRQPVAAGPDPRPAEITIPITVITEKGETIVKKSVRISLDELRRRSSSGEIMIDARGVGETI